MTIQLRSATITAGDIYTQFSRYLKTPIYHYGEQGFLTTGTYIRQEYVPNGDERAMMITSGVEYRPDLLSFRLYGTVNLWWLILEINGIKDVFEFTTGKTITIPAELPGV